MRVTRGALRASILSGIVAGVFPALTPEQTLAANPNKASAKCRKVTGVAVLSATKAGLRDMDSCHTRSDKAAQKNDSPGAAAACNTTGAGFGRAQNGGTGRIRAACKEGDPVLNNFPPGDFITPLFSVVKLVLDANSAELLGDPLFDGDRKHRKQLAKCHKMIAKGRSMIIADLVSKTNKCQKRIDKRATTFPPVDPSCVPGGSAKAGKATKMIQKSCGSVTPEQVDSCSPLPDCVIAAATRDGTNVARVSYGGPTQCGNDSLELGETCDDGPQGSDTCTPGCNRPSCPDGFLAPGEECDDGNRVIDDGCNNECKLPVCGDGVRQGGEVCDDGNTVAGDGCTNCMVDVLTCGPDGVDVTIRTSDYNPEEFFVAGFDANFLYPPPFSIPGDLNSLQVRRRVTELIGATDLGGVFAVADFSDEQRLFVTVGATDALPVGDIARIQLDCPEGTEVSTDTFSCNFVKAVDPFAVDIPPTALNSEVACEVSQITPRGVTVTTTTATVTTGPPVTTTSTTSTTTTTRPFNCGNGVIDGAEECDDQNDNPADGCTNICTICGNGVQAPPGEACDDGNLDSGDGCDANCTVTACGNGVSWPPETCDDGNLDDQDTCPSDCIVDFCSPVEADIRVKVSFAGSDNVNSLTVFLEYPEGKVNLVGFANMVLPGAIESLILEDYGPILNSNDLDHALRETIVVQVPDPILVGDLFRVHFWTCAGAPAPLANEFPCTVLSAANSSGGAVQGVTCSAVLE